MKHVEDLSTYEKGVLARLLLERLIKQGRLDERQGADRGHEIVVPVTQWQLEMLALFSEGGGRRP